MRRAALIGLTVVLLLPAGASAQPASARRTAGITVEVQPTKVKTDVGTPFTLRAQVSNQSGKPTPDLVANLHLVRLDSTEFVDPEDWSPRLAAELGSLAPGETAGATFRLDPVNGGRFALYVVLVSPNASQPVLEAGPPVIAEVASRRELSAGGGLAVALAVPLVVGAAALGTRALRRRARHTYER